MLLSAEQVSNIWAKFIEWMGHWFSTYQRNRRINEVELRLEGKRKRFSHVKLLWFTSYGSWPDGQLTNACGETLCVRPEHYRDGSDMRQAEWKEYAATDVDEQLEAIGLGPESGFSYQIGAPHTGKGVCSYADLGLTKDFGCYCCGVRFNPLAGKNEVLCDNCFDS